MSALDGTSIGSRGERELASRAQRSEVTALRRRVEQHLVIAGQVEAHPTERVAAAPAPSAAATPNTSAPAQPARSGRSASVKIRLRRLGRIRVPQYRIVVVDSRKKRDGKVLEEIGKYCPKEDPSYINVVSDRAQYWLGVGAQPSEAVEAILKVTGDWQKFKGLPGAEVTKVNRRTKRDIFNETLKEAAAEAQSEQHDGSSS